MDRYIAFLLLIGSVFVPLFGLLAANYLGGARRRIDVSQLYERGLYWYGGGLRAVAFVPWIAGVLAFHWIAPTGPEWWTNLVSDVAGTPLSERWGWLSASIPAFGISFALALLLSDGSKRQRAA